MSGLAEEPKKETLDSDRKTMFNSKPKVEGGDGVGGVANCWQASGFGKNRLAG